MPTAVGHTPRVVTAEKAYHRGTRRGLRALGLIGEEYRERRTALGLSQLAVASAASIARSRYTRIEAGRIEHLSIVEAARIGSVLGLDLSVRLYPGGQPLRDPPPILKTPITDRAGRNRTCRCRR
jgi:transcriptional regulator with XRE-family HTH domain